MSQLSYAEVGAAAHADERELVTIERQGDRAFLTLGDPDKLNVLSAPLMVQRAVRAAADASWDQSLTMEEFAEPICFTTRGFADGVDSVVAATSSRGH